VTKILLTGKTGQLGSELITALGPLGEVVATGRNEMDLADPDSIRKSIRETKPDIIVNAAGYAAVDKAESEPALATQVNGIAPGIIAEEAKRLGATLIHYSTDYVFDGVQKQIYTEDDPPQPVNVYGETKLAGERAVEAVGGAYVILRTCWIYSGNGPNFVLTMLKLARERREIGVVDDQTGSPTWARSLAQATADLIRREPSQSGIYHLSATGHTSRYEFARAIVETMAELTGSRNGWAAIKPITSDQYPLPARRPPHPVTDKTKIKRVYGIEMPRWEDQLRAFLAELHGMGHG